MQCFNGNFENKRRIMQRALEAGNRAARGEKRETIFWSRQGCCKAMYVCDKPNCDHNFYAEEVGVPLSLAYVERGIFEHLSNKSAGKWPQRFLGALSTQIQSEDLNEVWRQIALFVLSDSRYGLITTCRTPEQTDAVSRIIELFEANSQDAQAWESAATNARRVYSKGPDSNRRLKSEEAFVHAGAMACYSAAHFGYCFANPRYAGEALSWAPWALRYRHYAELMINVRERETPADERGLVNVGVAMLNFSDWMRRAEACEHEGEQVRMAAYEVYANQLIILMNRCVRRHAPGLGAAISSALGTARARIAGWSSRFGRYWNEETVG